VNDEPVAVAPFTYELPADRIAQRPVHPPEAAKMLVVEPGRPLSAALFSDLNDFLRPGDLLVFNQTRVAPARLRGSIEGSGAAVEFLLVSRSGEDCWICLAKPLKKLKPGVRVLCGESLIGIVKERAGEKEILVSFSAVDSRRSLLEVVEAAGEMPIPPYIRRGQADTQDRSDYQSIFAKVPGSIAAPTASLHFSEALISHLKERGVQTAGVLLHLGTASFLPIYAPEESTELRAPGVEWYQHSTDLLRQIAVTREQGGRVFAVGTSVVRALESMARTEAEDGQMLESALFIRPGFEFRLLDGIITNFHQPGTTHLLLVEAFVGAEQLSRMYKYALENDFRFLSYGDGMLLLPSA